MAWIEDEKGLIYNMRNVDYIGYYNETMNNRMKVVINTQHGNLTVGHIDYTPVNKVEDRMYKLNDGRVVPLEVMQDSARGVALYIAGIAESMLTIKQQDIKNVIDRELGC